MSTSASPAASTLLTFREYVGMLPAAWVFDHFVEKKSSGRKILSSGAVSEQIGLFSTPRSLVARFTALPPELRLTCSMVYLLGERGLAAPEKDIDLSHPLVRTFLVYAARNAGGVVRLFGFNEFEKELRNLMAAELAALAAQRRNAPPHPVVQEHCLRDLAAVSALACQGVLQKKKQGGLLRTAVQHLGKLAHESPAKKDADAFAGMLVQCGLRAGVLVETDRDFTCLPPAFDAWLRRPAADRIRECVDTVVAYTGAVRIPLLRATMDAAPGTWFSESIVPPQERPSFASGIRLLSWAGLVECAHSGASFLFGLPGADRGCDAADAAVTIMPDFTAVIAQHADPLDLYRFGKCGILHSLDRIYKGAIDRTVLNDALAKGLAGEELLHWLVSWGAPPNVVITVREWIREFNRLYITTHPVLVVCDEKVARQIDAFGAIRDLVEKVPAQVVYRIRRDQTDRVIGLLSDMGFDHRMPGAAAAAVDAARSAPEAAHEHDWTPVLEETEAAGHQPLPLRGKKYGSGLKSLDLNETMHVIEYAILTGNELSIEYAGSPLIRKGRYTVTPQSCSRGAEPVLEAAGTGGRKRKFLVSKISGIGVGGP